MARSTLLAALVSAVVLAGAVFEYRASRPLRSPYPARPIFVISGRGWGHGVGMAQWGAYGYAQQG